MIFASPIPHIYLRLLNRGLILGWLGKAREKDCWRWTPQREQTIFGSRARVGANAPAPQKCGLFYDRLDALKDFIGVLEGADMDEEDFPAPIQHDDQRISGEF